MSATPESLKVQEEIDLYQEIETLIRKNPRQWPSILAVVGIAGGVIAPIMGATADAVAWLVASTSVIAYLHALSIVLYSLTIPLLLLGASCLDLLEAKTSKLSPVVTSLSVGAARATTIRPVSRAIGNHRLNGIAVLLFLLVLPVTTRAQQRVVNVPTIDTLSPCEERVETGVNSKPKDFETRMESSSSPSNSELPERTARLRFNWMFPATADADPRFVSIVAYNDPEEALPFTSIFPNTPNARTAQAVTQQKQQSNARWQYGGFVDLAYPLNFNHPANHLFRSRGTAFRTDSVWLNMAAFYVRKRPTVDSRWGIELTAQAGKDAEFFGFSATAPNIAGYKFLRQLGPTNVSYLAPVGKGLALQAGIFSSFIGYDSLYAKDNLNYTRPWGADFTPYFMMGANASYPFTEKLTGTFFVVNGYWHLARANSAPSAGGQIAYKLTPRWTVKETTLFGPHQRNTAFEFWRFLTDTIVERKTAKLTTAFEYIYSTERVDAQAKPRALMMSWQMPTRWQLDERWSLSFRPEVFWDRDGCWTLARQTVKAFTSTLEYRIPYQWTNTIFRLEHRWDDSRGPEGGFFSGREVSPGVIGLTPSQHLLIFATIFTFDSPAPK